MSHELSTETITAKTALDAQLKRWASHELKGIRVYLGVGVALIGLSETLRVDATTRFGADDAHAETGFHAFLRETYPDLSLRTLRTYQQAATIAGFTPATSPEEIEEWCKQKEIKSLSSVLSLSAPAPEPDSPEDESGTVIDITPEPEDPSKIARDLWKPFLDSLFAARQTLSSRALLDLPIASDDPDEPTLTTLEIEAQSTLELIQTAKAEKSAAKPKRKAAKKAAKKAPKKS